MTTFVAPTTTISRETSFSSNARSGNHHVESTDYRKTADHELARHGRGIPGTDRNGRFQPAQLRRAVRFTGRPPVDLEGRPRSDPTAATGQVQGTWRGRGH